MTDKQIILAEMDLLKQQLLFIETAERMSNPIQEEPVSEDLEDFALQYAGHHAPYDDCMQEIEAAFKAGAEWQKNKMMDDAVDGVVLKVLAEKGG